MQLTPVSRICRSRTPLETDPAGRGRGAGVTADAGGRGVVGGPQGLGEHHVGLVDRALHPGGDDRLAGEPLAVADADVGGEDDGCGGGDDLGASGAPEEPCVSTCTAIPARVPAATSESAAM